MKYYNIVNKQIELTEKGKWALDFLGLTLEQLKNISDEKLRKIFETEIENCRIPYGELGIPSSTGKPCTPGDSGIYNWNSPEAIKLKKKLIGGRLNQEHRWTYGDEQVDGFKPQDFDDVNINLKGRYPANLLVSDHVLDQGVITKAKASSQRLPSGPFAGTNNEREFTIRGHNDTGDISRYYSLDAWWAQHIGDQIKLLPKPQQQTFPFLFVPKASKSEKNKGLQTTSLPIGQSTGGGGMNNEQAGGAYGSIKSPAKNFHPTSKPIQLMSYLITLGSRPGDVVLDPFAGSGTTGIACKLESRDYILIELMPEYYAIMKARLKATQVQQKLF